MLNVTNNGAQIQISGLIMNGTEKSATLYSRMKDSDGQIHYMYQIPELGIRLSEIIAPSPENAVSQALLVIKNRMKTIVEDAEKNIGLINDKVRIEEI